ncbi:hypothetical protein Taro_027348 [Colocasia esculenta]|uniref:Uncharacterized protein n=1 Tax=Colocasia esculenta TaxID=4460 RepID=A0A843VJV4_COLES|nr:hypothetical protein [Colocasia esculenta]
MPQRLITQHTNPYVPPSSTVDYLRKRFLLTPLVRHETDHVKHIRQVYVDSQEVAIDSYCPPRTNSWDLNVICRQTRVGCRQLRNICRQLLLVKGCNNCSGNNKKKETRRLVVTATASSSINTNSYSSSSNDKSSSSSRKKQEQEQEQEAGVAGAGFHFPMITDWNYSLQGLSKTGVCRQPGSGCQQLLSSQNQFLGSEHYLSTDQIRLSTGEEHLSTDEEHLSTATTGFCIDWVLEVETLSTGVNEYTRQTTKVKCKRLKNTTSAHLSTGPKACVDR